MRVGHHAGHRRTGGTQRNFTLPERLPDLPASPMPEQNIVNKAMESRLDLRMARLEIEGLAKSLGLTKSTRFVNVLDASYLNKSATGGPHMRGYEIELVLPIFDWGDARTAKAEASTPRPCTRWPRLW